MLSAKAPSQSFGNRVRISKMIIRDADSFGQGELGCKSVKGAYRSIVAGLLFLGTTILLVACSEDSGWSTSMSAMPLGSGAPTGDAAHASDGMEEPAQ